MNKLILLRHGQSQWNLENRFTGWENVPLTTKGINEAIRIINNSFLFHFNFLFTINENIIYIINKIPCGIPNSLT